MRIPLADGTFGYARTLEPPFDAFYEYRTESRTRIWTGSHPSQSSSRLLSAFWTGFVEVIGWRKLEEPLAQPIVQYRQEVGHFGRCTIFDTLEIREVRSLTSVSGSSQWLSGTSTLSRSACSTHSWGGPTMRWST